MIYKNGKELTALYLGTKAIAAAYLGARLVWEAISSCFGAGYWDNDKGWGEADGWL